MCSIIKMTAFEFITNIDDSVKDVSMPACNDLNGLSSQFCEDYELDFTEIDNISARDWIDYLAECDSWNDDIESFHEKDLFPKSFKIPRPCANVPTDVSYESYILGHIKQSDKLTDLKYFTRDNKIFCDNKKCKGCKYVHSFKEIPMCSLNCTRVVLDNNIYFGTCSKRHTKETYENFVMRKNIKCHKIKSACFEIYIRMSNKSIKKLLESAKNVGINTIVLKIVQKQKTVEDFFSIRT